MDRLRRRRATEARAELDRHLRVRGAARAAHDGGALAERAFANRDAAQYEDDDAYDAALLRFLVENLLLGRSGPFPVPPGEAPTPSGGHGLLQHHLAGTGYPEADLATFHAWHARADRHGG